MPENKPSIRDTAGRNPRGTPQVPAVDIAGPTPAPNLDTVNAGVWPPKDIQKPKRQRVGNPRPINLDLISDQTELINPVAAESDLAKPIEPEKSLMDSEDTVAPEDEFVGDVKNIGAIGLFRDGLTIRGKRLLEPTATGYRSAIIGDWRRADLSPEMKGISLIERGKAHWSDRADLSSREYLTLRQDPNNPEMAVLSYLINNDDRDITNRYYYWAIFSFHMPLDRAREYLDLVKTSDDGGKIADRFYTKALGDTQGIKRLRVGGLRILDEDLYKAYYESGSSKMVFDTAPFKPY